jgi:hypothetical protein
VVKEDIMINMIPLLIDFHTQGCPFLKSVNNLEAKAVAELDRLRSKKGTNKARLGYVVIYS